MRSGTVSNAVWEERREDMVLTKVNPLVIASSEVTRSFAVAVKVVQEVQRTVIYCHGRSHCGLVVKGCL